MGANTARVLVLDTDGQAGLEIIRSLGRRGVTVIAGASSNPSLGSLSRYSNGSFEYPDPDPDADRFLSALETHLRESEYDVVIPVLDKTTALLARAKPRLEETDTIVATENPDQFERVFDKGRLFERIESTSVPIPETYTPESLEEALELAETIQYPVVVKPRSKTIWHNGRHHQHLISDRNYASDPAELRDIYRAMVEEHESLQAHLPMIQSFVPGETVCATFLAEEGEILTMYQERRLRTYPASGGNSTLLEAMDDENLRTVGETVVEAIEWTGPGMVECMRRPDGTDVLIEVNGRYWGSVPYSIRSGVDFPWLHLQLLLGEPVVGPESYRTDRIHRRLFYGDFKWLGEQLAEANLLAVWPFVRDFFRAEHSFVDLDDPVPMAMVVGEAPLAALRSVRRRLPVPGRPSAQ